MTPTQKLKDTRRRQRQELLKLLGGKCVHCGSTERLEFDHIDPTTKLFTIATNLGKRTKNLLPEIKKCQLLCKHCHCKKTALDNRWGTLRHGTHSGYTKFKCRCVECKVAAGRLPYPKVYKYQEARRLAAEAGHPYIQKRTPKRYAKI